MKDQESKLFSCKLRGQDEWSGRLDLGSTPKELLLFSEQQWDAPLFSPIELVLDDARCAVVFPTTASNGESWRAENTLFRYRGLAETVLVGSNSWESNSGVKRIVFRMRNASILFHRAGMVRRDHSESDENRTLTQTITIPKQPLIDIQTDEVQLRITFGTNYGGWVDSTTSHVVRHIELTFAENRHLQDALGCVRKVIQFLELSCGAPCALEDAIVFQTIDAEGSPTPKFDLYDDDLSKVRAEIETRIIEAVWHLSTPEEIASFSAALEAWILKGEEWNDSLSLFETVVEFDTLYSANRLQKAINLLEQFPFEHAAINIPDEKLDQLKECSTNLAKSLELEDEIVQRVPAVLGQLKSPSLKLRIKNLFDYARGRHADAAYFSVWLFDDLMKAAGLRFMGAHGKVIMRPADTDKLITCTMAVETFVVLLLTADIPLSAGCVTRLGSHRLVSNYGHRRGVPSPTEIRDLKARYSWDDN